tara:strand:- start:38 stop:475 length:438 start_codon:yes stop_codon:yes gene_type:complete
MKKLTLLFLSLVLTLSIFSQTSELLIYPTRATKKACFKGDYKTIENYLSNKCKQDKQTFDRYVLFSIKELNDYNYLFSNIDSDQDYYESIAYAIDNILHPDIKIYYFTYKKYTALTQYHDNGKQVMIIIVADAPKDFVLVDGPQN